MKKLLLALLVTVNTVHAQVVTQNDLVQGTLGWTTQIQGNGNAVVTSANPRYGFGDVGNGSLQLHTTGKMNDWVFATKYADTNWGMLSQITGLSFEWFRSSTPNWDAESVGNITLYDWKYKSPAFRLYFGDNTEMVWESYFNRPINNDLSYINTWQTENILGGNFWYRNGDGYSLNTQPCFTDEIPVWGGNVQAVTINDILSCYGDKEVTGVAVGLGSQWPYKYRGFVDNVQIQSNGEYVVNANFDNIPSTAVPEPATYAMMLVGLVGIGFMTRRKKMS